MQKNKKASYQIYVQMQEKWAMLFPKLQLNLKNWIKIFSKILDERYTAWPTRFTVNLSHLANVLIESKFIIF